MSRVLISGHQAKVSATVAAPTRHDLCTKVRRVIRSEGSGRTPGCWSTAAISRRTLSSSDMGVPPWDVSLVVTGHRSAFARRLRLFATSTDFLLLRLDCRGSSPRSPLLPGAALSRRGALLQFDIQIARLPRRNGNRLLVRTGEGLVRHQLVGSGGNVGDGEFAVGAGDGIVRTVDDIDPPFHPAMCVTIDPHLARPWQLDRNSLTLVGESEVEHGALAVIAVRVVKHRIAIDDVQAACTYHLNVGLEFAFVVVDFGLLG